MEIPLMTEEAYEKATSNVVSPKTSNPDGSDISITSVPSALIDREFSASTQLQSSVLGAKVMTCSDDWFASADNLLTLGPVVRKAGYYVHTGAWMDGWETRRHNQEDFDWVIIQLGCVGIIEGIEVDTAYFNGNEAPEVALDGYYMPKNGSNSEGKMYTPVDHKEFRDWKEILTRQPCGPSARQAWRVSGPLIEGKHWTHLRLKMYPDGGIARLRVYGRVVPPPLAALPGPGENRPLEDLACTLNGGVAIACSDQHFGVKSNLTLPGRGKDMGDGWETARSRDKDHVDWVIVRLGLRGKSIDKIVVDTKDFRGNFPRTVKVEAWAQEPAKAALGLEGEVSHNSRGWIPLLAGEQKCQADHEHIFEGDDLIASVPLQDWVWTHVKMTIIPDGGVKRLRVFGRRA